MVPGLVHKFKMICIKGVSVTGRKPNVGHMDMDKTMHIKPNLNKH